MTTSEVDSNLSYVFTSELTIMIDVECAGCKKKFQRTTKQVNAVIKKSNVWRCKSCANCERNKLAAKPLGSIRVSTKGYIFEKTISGWVQQHRLVAEQKIGRKLKPNELVHHLDENKKNNCPNNLVVELWGSHTAHHHTGSKRTGISLENIRKGILKRSSTKLSYEIVERIKALVSEGRTQLSIATELGVSPMTISRAVRGESFKNGKLE